MKLLRSVRNGGTSWYYYVIATLIAIVFINEWLVYYIQSWRWPPIPTDSSLGLDKEQVVLMVADPQLQGYQDEGPFPIGQLARWDIDNYVRKSFSYAFSYCKPDVVLFLGDLFDEGSKASGQEYMITLDRFNSVFEPAKHIKKIYIPGDNDIGGELPDIRTEVKEKRYTRHFENITGVVRFGFIDYVKTDVKTSSVSSSKLDEIERIGQRLTAPLCIIMNHESMLGLNAPKHFAFPIHRRLKAKLVLSAHWHRSRIYRCEDCLKDNDYSWSVEKHDMSMIDDYVTIDMRGQYSLNEIAVPTCSYRMGEKNMGFGVAIIGVDGVVQYTVLWLPRRYTCVVSYIVVLSLMALSFLINRLCVRSR